MIESQWAHPMRRYTFSERPLSQFYDLLGFTDLVTSLANDHPEDSVALYASKILWLLPVAEQNLADFLTIFWRLIHLDPRIVSVASQYCASLSPDCFKLRRVRNIIRESIDYHLADFIERRYALETCWLLWLCRQAGISLARRTSKALSDFEHPLVALAALELERHGLLKETLDASSWKASVSGDDDVTGARWMLAYEMRRNGDLRQPMKNEFFDFLKSKNISFLKS
jgi:hypothetical protein